MVKDKEVKKKENKNDQKSDGFEKGPLARVYNMLLLALSVSNNDIYWFNVKSYRQELHISF